MRTSEEAGDTGAAGCGEMATVAEGLRRYADQDIRAQAPCRGPTRWARCSRSLRSAPSSGRSSRRRQQVGCTGPPWAPSLLPAGSGSHSPCGRRAGPTRCSTSACSVTAASPPRARHSRFRSWRSPVRSSSSSSTCSSCSVTRCSLPASRSFPPPQRSWSATGMGEHLGAHVDARRAVAAGIVVAGLGVAVQAAFADGSSYTPKGVGLACSASVSASPCRPRPNRS